MAKEDKLYISACDLLIKELGRIREKLDRKVTAQKEKHRESIIKIMQYKSEDEILDAYGWGYLTQAQYDYELEQFRLGEAALNTDLQSKEVSALMLIIRIIQDIEYGKSQAIFNALPPEEQIEELKRRKDEEKARKKRSFKGDGEYNTIKGVVT